jgi:hypothetical protein
MAACCSHLNADPVSKDANIAGGGLNAAGVNRKQIYAKADCSVRFAYAAFRERTTGAIMLDDWMVRGLATVVLVVDHDVLQRLEEGAELRREGFDVVEAATVSEAIMVLQSRAVDIVLSQLDLEGSETLTDWVHNRRPSTTIIWGPEAD